MPCPGPVPGINKLGDGREKLDTGMTTLLQICVKYKPGGALSLASAGSCIDRHLGIDMYISMVYNPLLHMYIVYAQNLYTDRHPTFGMHGTMHI